LIARKLDLGLLMEDFLLAHEPAIRLAVFVSVFAAMALWEVLAPRRPQSVNRMARWPSNVGIVALDAVIVRIIFPTGAVALAMLSESKGWGLLNAWAVPTWLAVPLAVIVLDLVVYLQHVLFHAVPALWRLHRMHHADLEFDVTTGARFHPIEIALSMLIKLAVVAALGAPAVAVLIFEVLLNATAMFNHSNVRLPTTVDRVVRWLVVTPDMHRVHHSVIVQETNSNFGFNLPWWDRLFGTYRAQPASGHAAMTIGIEDFRNPAEQRLDRMLTQPFRGGEDHYALGSGEIRKPARSDVAPTEGRTPV
jgi:sterol desaturase/sphingolipid hydroxylase (fatty acid hydroxylase superfamily)